MSRSKLDTLANVAIILVAIVALVVLIPRAIEIIHPHPNPMEARAPQPGEQLPALKAIMPAGADRALVIAVQPLCHFCNESLPFYKQLMEQRNQKGSAVKVIAAVPNAGAREDELKRFQAAGAQPDGVVQADFNSIKVPGTPTVMLVDRTGKVLAVWVGKLEESKEQEVLKRL
jgi:thioredoxin-related protein